MAIDTRRQLPLAVVVLKVVISLFKSEEFYSSLFF
jgi:hypothetical protein